MRSVRVGVLSREFFELGLGRMGGFGFAARVVASTLADLAPAVEPVLLSGAAAGPDGQRAVSLDGARVVFGTGNGIRDAWRWQRLGLDALLTIDWHSSFLPVCRALPRTPLLLWSRDPRSRAEWDTIATLRLPGSAADGLEPTGADRDAGPARVAEWSRRWRRPVRFCFTDEFLVDRFRGRYGIEPAEPVVLGTPVDASRGDDVTTDHRAGATELPDPVRGGAPYVVFLGRLDPIKRPWVFAAVAAEVPGIQFVALGQQHLDRGWQPVSAPNLHWLGHVDGAVKDALLAGAVATMNTSIHEAVPLSLLESLHLGTPVVACLDLGGLTARFGVAVPAVPGDGLAAVPALAAGVRSLAGDRSRREELARAGKEWVQGRHSEQAFRTTLGQVLIDVGVGAPWLT